ncbi:hypothetical protein NX059_006433 [Plenodomus lindquistii]|nr:hypothetical protein NX059_006433 [Plenodomus lindquistii]
MAPNQNPNRKTNIIDDPVALAQSLAQNRKGKSKGKGRGNARATGGSSIFAPQNTGISKAKASRQAPAAPPGISSSTPDPQLYEGHGLKILFNEKGKPRLHARTSMTFRNKGMEAILDIVEAYAGSGKRHEFQNADKPKAFIANWIEMAETLAFGKNPASKLTRADWEASEFTHPNQRSAFVANSAKNSRRPPVETEGDLDNDMYDLLSHTEHKRKHVEKDTSDRIDHVKRQKREHAANMQNRGTSFAKESVTAKSEIDKRVPDNVRIQTSPAPTHVAPQQSAPIQKSSEQLAREKRNMESYTITDSHDRKRPGEGTKHVFSTPNATESSSSFQDASNREGSEGNREQQASTVSVFSGPMPSVRGNKDAQAPAAEQERLRMFMHDIGLDSTDPDRTSAIILGPSKNMRRVVTVTEGAHGQFTLHCTVLNRFNYDASRNTKPVPRPYLKNGRHGSGGIFDNDPDRATGLGHDYEPEDARNFVTFMQLKSKATQRHDDGKPVFPQAVRDFKVLQPWYAEYVRQYPGKRLDQWPCGCSKIIDEDGDESEEE